MNDAQLQGIAAQALNMAKLDLERGRFNFLLAGYTTGEGLHRMSMVEALIAERLGEDWLNSGSRKDAGFGVMRMAANRITPEALVFVSGTNYFEPTAKLKLLPLADQKKFLDTNHDQHHEFVRQGWLTMADALTCVAQNPERVCLYTQKCDAAHHFIAPPEVHFFPQENFGGRLKMYGPEDSDFGYGEGGAKCRPSGTSKSAS